MNKTHKPSVSQVVTNPARRFTIKNLTYSRGHEGEPLAHFTLYADGRRAALFDAADQGGEDRFTPIDAALFDEYEAFCKALPPVTGTFGEGEDATTYTLEMDAALYTSTLIERFETEKAIRAVYKKNLTPFTAPGMKAGVYRTARVHPTVFKPELRARALAGYPGAVFAHEDMPAFLDLLLRKE